MHRAAVTVSMFALVLAGACGGSETVTPVVADTVRTTPTTPTPPVGTTPTPVVTAVMRVLGRGNFRPQRTSAELAVRGNTAYTTTWGNSSAAASVFYIWDVSADRPVLVDSIRIDNATTLGDIAISDDGALLVVATERSSGSIVVYSLADPRKPVFLSRFTNAETTSGVHTAELGRVNKTLYAFLSIDQGNGIASKLVTVDLSNPAAPRQVFSKFIGRPFVHDTHVRDGILFLGLWNDGVAIWDIGGGGRGGTVEAPVELARLQTANGEVHNIWWLKDPVTNAAKYAFIGEEGPGSVGGSSSGDVHVVDVSALNAPREVAFYTVPGAGTHNFSVDEGTRILYAAYYNGGVRALDVNGDLGTCTAVQRSSPANSTLQLCDLRKMGRELGVGLLDQGNPVFVWGVQYLNGFVYASDMLNGLWKLSALGRPI